MFIKKVIGGQNISCLHVVHQGYTKWIPLGEIQKILTPNRHKWEAAVEHKLKNATSQRRVLK
jgi:hypothetical protein